MGYNKKNIKDSYAAMAMMGLAMWAQSTKEKKICEIRN
jgi:hypothetical protein